MHGKKPSGTSTPGGFPVDGGVAACGLGVDIHGGLCSHEDMDAVDEALRRSREDRLAASLAAWKTKYARKQRDRAVRQARRRAGLALRHQAKLARIPQQRQG